jgi:hypothetical protein
VDETIAHDNANDNQVNAYTDDRQQALARALGHPLTQLLDRKQALVSEIQVIDAEIYQLLVNLLQSQIGAMVTLFEAKLERER